MKFTDGYWLTREGFKPAFATEIVHARREGDRLRLEVATRNIRHRGDTLGGPVLTMSMWSPMADVVGIKVRHYTGGADKKPCFPLDLQPGYKPEFSFEGQKASVVAGGLTASLDASNGWNLTFSAGEKVLTSSRGKSIGYILSDEGESYVHEQLQLEVGELVYGLGERFTPFIKNGQVVEIWNEDGGTGSDQAYKNVPFYLTTHGYGVFVNQPERVSFEVASEKVSKVQFSVEGEELEYFVIYGPTPKEILSKYTALTGRPALPPPWSFGLWLTTSFTTNYDEKTVTEFIQGMADRNLPLHTFHFDCFWMKGFRWCDFEWDSDVFPDPVGMLQRLKARGLKICVWINPYIAQQSPLFDEGKAGGFFLKRPNGDVWQWDMWQPGMAIVDFTNPEARKWYGDKLRVLMDMGVDAFKTDFGERIPLDVVYADGSDPKGAHNFYPYLYNQTVFDVLEEKRGKGEAVVFARSATAGCQKYPVHWGGDCYSDYPSMAESLRGGLSLSLSGFGFWSHDIGGFEGMPPADVYKRWVAFGLLSSHSRLHGSTSYRVPWLFDEEACDVVRAFTNLKCRLMPYLYGAAVEAHKTGVPVMRPMVVEFPADMTCRTLDRQYMLGPKLLFAPVFSTDGMVEVYLPEGRWTHWFSGKAFEGGAWYTLKCTYTEAALFVRPNSVLPIGENDQKPDYDYARNLTFMVYEPGPEANARCDVPNGKGDVVGSLAMKGQGGLIEFTVSGILPDCQVVLVNGDGYQPAQNCDVKASEKGLVVIPHQGADRFTIVLADQG